MKYRALADFTGVISMRFGEERVLDSESEHTKVLLDAGLIEPIKKKVPQTKKVKRAK